MSEMTLEMVSLFCLPELRDKSQVLRNISQTLCVITCFLLILFVMVFLHLQCGKII